MAAGSPAGAERFLEDALGKCPEHAGVLREFSAFHFQQGRYTEAEALVLRYLEVDPESPWGWDLLAASRYLRDEPRGALEAWNRIDRPLVRERWIGGELGRGSGFAGGRAGDAPTAGLESRLLREMGIVEGTVLTPELLLRGERRLADLPALRRVRLDYRPLAEGGAALEGTVAPGPRHPFRLAEVPAHAIRTLRAQVYLSGSNTLGALEHWELDALSDGRFRRVRAGLGHPAPLGHGVWHWKASIERGSFAAGPEEPAVEEELRSFRWSQGRRDRAGLWTAFTVGYDHRREGGGGPMAGVSARWDAPPRDTREATLIVPARSRPWSVIWTVEAWNADHRFARSRLEARGTRSLGSAFDLVVRGSGEALSTEAPLDLQPRFGSDRSATSLMRARRAVDDEGVARTAYPGRAWLTGSIEFRRWSRGPATFPLGLAVFADGVRTLRTTDSDGPRGGVHVGAGLRIREPGGDGGVRLDWAVDPGAGGSRVSVAWVGTH